MRAVWLSLTQLSMELYFGATLQRRAVSEEKKVRFGSHLIELGFFLKNDYEEKNGSPLQKRADIQNYSPREPFWLSFSSQCLHTLTRLTVTGQALKMTKIQPEHLTLVLNLRPLKINCVF